jgi:radical SAM protein with 4Fe4S-binding SPASM domain
MKETLAMPAPNGRSSDWTFETLAWSARTLGGIAPLRRALAERMEGRLRARALRPAAELRHPPAVEQDRVAMGLALLAVGERALSRGRVGRPALRALIKTLFTDVLARRGDAGAKDRFRARHGQNPPDFLTISPGKACNLRCRGCYANSGAHKEKLDWATMDRLVGDTHDSWGSRFVVVSGGEPLAWRESGKGILDLAEKRHDCFFIMYTNGTLIDDRVARRMGELGNVAPALSIEGMRARTDARRGEGVFDKVLAAMERLRREGVVFGVSLTATRENADELLSDEVVDTFFEQMGALFGFIFHYMPIGRSFTLDLMMTPEQRFRLYERSWALIRERHLFLLDFWNGATASNGCIAGGRAGGYFHVNWNGDVSPCVFFPYAPVNINEVYARGGTLEEVWSHPFFADIRKWQRDYGHRESHEACPDCRNWIAPCLIRDHHEDFMRIMGRHDARPTDDDAREALADPDYHAGLERFDREFQALTEPVWEARYKNGGRGTAPGPMTRR